MTAAQPQGSRRIGLIGLGEVGQVLASDLHDRVDADLSAWDRLFPVAGSEPLRAAQELTFLRAADGMADAVREREIVISAVTAGECRAAAQEAAAALTRGTFYLDLNSVSPATRASAAELIEARGGRYVEAAVMSPIAPKRIGSPIWLGGPHARHFLPLARTLGFAGAAVYSDTLGEASAAKMCRSVIVKGMEALLAESLLTARRHGVEDVVLASLQDLFPVGDWRNLARYMISRSLQHGRRRAEEMREAARTVEEAGLEPSMSRGCVERQQWAAEHPEALSEQALTDMLDHMLARIPAPAPARAAATGPATGQVRRPREAERR
jgi:3-hydroxyisobutyrate dehydrogenase-like beta-hydroxyacid dehydrogenase